MDPRSKISRVGAGLRPAHCHRAASPPPSRALLTRSPGGSALLQQGELDFSPAKKRCLLERALAPGFSALASSEPFYP